MNFLEFLGLFRNTCFVVIFSFLLYFRFTCTLFGMATFSPSFCLPWFASCLSIISTLSKFICTIIVFLFSVWTNCWTLASVLLISLELLSFLREDNVFYPDSYTRSIYSGWTFMNSQFANHPSSKTFLYFARFFRTRERPCMNRVRSLLSMRDMFLGYSFPARPYNRVFGRVGSFMTTGLSINGISWSGQKKTVWRGKTRLTSPDVRAATSSKASRDSNRASFFPPHSKRQNEALPATSFPGSCPTRS